MILCGDGTIRNAALDTCLTLKDYKRQIVAEDCSGKEHVNRWEFKILGNFKDSTGKYKTYGHIRNANFNYYCFTPGYGQGVFADTCVEDNKEQHWVPELPE